MKIMMVAGRTYEPLSTLNDSKLYQVQIYSSHKIHKYSTLSIIIIIYRVLKHTFYDFQIFMQITYL